MQLIDGLKKYKSDPTYESFTLRLESQARDILVLLKRCGDIPDKMTLSTVKEFLVDVERWKADCLEQRTGNAVQNSEESIWYAFKGAMKATADLQAILSIMQLKGFGSSVDDETGLRRAKVATSVLRFLWPDKWGVVDWRVAAILGPLKKNGWDVDRAMSIARKQKAEEMRQDYDMINEHAACEINGDYRRISHMYSDLLPRAADVDMALFGLSLMIWPMRGARANG